MLRTAKNDHMSIRAQIFQSKQFGHVLNLAQANFPTAQANRFCNLVRYMDFLQQTVDKQQVFPRIAVIKTPFKAPAPVTPPAKVHLL